MSAYEMARRPTNEVYHSVKRPFDRVLRLAGTRAPLSFMPRSSNAW